MSLKKITTEELVKELGTREIEKAEIIITEWKNGASTAGLRKKYGEYGAATVESYKKNKLNLNLF